MLDMIKKREPVFFLSDVEFAKLICSRLMKEEQSPQKTIKSGHRAVFSHVRHYLWPQSPMGSFCWPQSWRLAAQGVWPIQNRVRRLQEKGGKSKPSTCMIGSHIRNWFLTSAVDHTSCHIDIAEKSEKGSLARSGCSDKKPTTRWLKRCVYSGRLGFALIFSFDLAVASS